MAKKLPKEPKLPKANASLATWENYNQRHAEWKKKCQSIEADVKKKEAIIKKAKADRGKR